MDRRYWHTYFHIIVFKLFPQFVCTASPIRREMRLVTDFKEEKERKKKGLATELLQKNKTKYADKMPSLRSSLTRSREESIEKI